MAKSPNPKTMIGFRADAAQRDAIKAVAEAGGISETEVMRICAPNPTTATAMMAMASSPIGFQSLIAANFFSGITGFLDAAGLDSRYRNEIVKFLQAGDTEGLSLVYLMVLSARSAASGEVNAQYELITVQDGDGRVPAPRGSAAKIVDGEIRIFPPEPPAEPSQLLVADLLVSLRSEDMATRVKAGSYLAHAVGKGLALSGASELDAEHGAGKDANDLITAAMLGDKTAVDQLEAALTANPDEAKQTPSEAREPAE